MTVTLFFQRRRGLELAAVPAVMITRHAPFIGFSRAEPHIPSVTGEPNYSIAGSIRNSDRRNAGGHSRQHWHDTEEEQAHG